jgi:hypothetical protein
MQLSLPCSLTTPEISISSADNINDGKINDKPIKKRITVLDIYPPY